MTHFFRSLLLAVVVAVCAGCSSTPPVPDWQMNAHGALARSAAAYLAGNDRVEGAEFARAREAIASSGRVDLLARAELTRCATRVGSLVLAPCAGFEALRTDAPAAERAYADYLAGRVSPADMALLPPPHRALANPGNSATAVTGALRAIADPLAQLAAAGVLFRTGRANPDVLAIAVDTASAQGWRRPLLAWLGVQAQRAERAGDAVALERLRRRMALVQGGP
jgi:hypothetical protein